jgi:hypothetical protein
MFTEFQSYFKDCFSPISFMLFINNIDDMFDHKRNPILIGNLVINYPIFALNILLSSETKDGL